MTSDRSELTEQALQPTTDEKNPLHSNDHFAAELRNFSPLGIAAILIILLSGNVFVGSIIIPFGAILVLVWVRLSHTPWRNIGYRQPKSWIAVIAIGLVFGIAFKLFMKAVIMPLLGTDPINQTYHYLTGNIALLPAAVWAMLIAGFGEETVFRGYIFERFGKLFGHGVWAKIAIVLLTSAWFGLGHLSDQGIAGVEQAAIVGLVFGTIFTITGRIWVVMFAHAAFDLTALAIIYWNLESTVAHLIF
jgi:membrane protease YdiL (CAAX protease family)